MVYRWYTWHLHDDGDALSSTCLKQDPPPLDPTGGADPTVIGNYEDGSNSGFLTGNNCTSFYLSFDLASGDPFVINNNIPLKPIFDYGDAPDTYGTDATAGNSGSDPIGARHNIIDGIHLGTTAPDSEDDASTPLDGSGDGAEDDGITLSGSSLQSQSLTVGDTITLDVTALGDGVLNAWIDWNGNGVFDDATESIADNADVSGGTLSVPVPATATVGTTYARFRYSSDTDLEPTSSASDGEVEDYQVAISQPVATNPDVVLVERITAINGDRTQNPNDNTPLNAVINDGVANSADDENNWPASYLVGAINGGFVKPGDEIERTVYFLNAGSSDAASVRICDWIRPYESFLTGVYGGNDIELVVDGTTYQLTAVSDAADRAELSTVSSLPAGPTCNLPAAATNAIDEVLVLDITGTTGDPTGFATLPGTTGKGTPSTAYGYFRFTTKVDE